MVKQHGATSKGSDGNLRFEVLRGSGRQNHFAILEAWKDQAAREAHAGSDKTVKFRNDLEAHLYSPYDERPHVGLVADPASIALGDSATVYVVTHVDIIPPEQFPPCKRQVNESGPCGNALVEKLVNDSREHDGNVRMDVLTQANRPNHMTLVEAWESAKAQEDHTVHGDTRTFRDSLSASSRGMALPTTPCSSSIH